MSNDTQIAAHTALAKECGAITYTHRSNPHEAAVSFGPMAWEKFVEASARQLAEQGAPANSVKIPTGEDEAALMVLTSMAWLKDNAPHRLKDATPQAPKAEPVLLSDAEREAFNIAWRQTWGMVDPLRPPPAGTYYLGEHNGIIAALKTIRENFDAAIRATKGGEL